MHFIEQEHPEYVVNRQIWNKYGDLYAGGEQLKVNASEYLTRRQKEPPDVYGERLDRVFYENYIGSIIDWYAATLFRREPVLHVEGQNSSGRAFFSAFAEDCDLKGTALSDFFRKQLIDVLVYGCSYVMVDFPPARTKPTSRAEEDATGGSRAYVVSYSPDEVINWSVDETGAYEWAVVRTSHLRKASVEGTGWERETRWLHMDRKMFRTYRQVSEGSKQGPVECISEGHHGFAQLGRVPLFKQQISHGLWLMNKAALLQLEHFNKSNALSWALTMGLFATPVVYSERDWNQIVGESYYIQLGPEDRFGWTEPEGKVYQIAADNLNRLQEEVYRVCYLMSQGGNAASTVSSQSGLSKLRDFAVTQEVLRAYGDLIKDLMKRVLRSIAVAREDTLEIDVSGLDDFDIRDFAGDLEDARNLLALGIDSPTLKQQIFKRLAHKYLSDVRQDVKDRICREIDSHITT